MKKVFGMRGLPGSGKDFYIQKRWGNKATICSADLYFIVDGEYRFDPSKLGEAHNSCMKNFLSALASEVEIVVVNNTNINIWEIAPYASVAAAMGYEFEVIEVKAKVEDCIARNSHGVPAQIIGAMAEAKRREILLPRWQVTEFDSKPKNGNDPDVAKLMAALEKRGIAVSFALDERDGIDDTFLIVAQPSDTDNLELYQSYGGGFGLLSRSRIAEIVQLIEQSPSVCTSQDIQEAIVWASNVSGPCLCAKESAESLHYNGAPGCANEEIEAT